MSGQKHIRLIGSPRVNPTFKACNLLRGFDGSQPNFAAALWELNAIANVGCRTACFAIAQYQTWWTRDLVKTRRVVVWILVSTGIVLVSTFILHKTGSVPAVSKTGETVKDLGDVNALRTNPNLTPANAILNALAAGLLGAKDFAVFQALGCSHGVVIWVIIIDLSLLMSFRFPYNFPTNRVQCQCLYAGSQLVLAASRVFPKRMKRVREWTGRSVTQIHCATIGYFTFYCNIWHLLREVHCFVCINGAVIHLDWEVVGGVMSGHMAMSVYLFIYLLSTYQPTDLSTCRPIWLPAFPLPLVPSSDLASRASTGSPLLGGNRSADWLAHSFTQYRYLYPSAYLPIYLYTYLPTYTYTCIHIHIHTHISYIYIICIYI